MSSKKEYTIEELEDQYKKNEEIQRALKEQIEQKKKEEKELREAKLALEKETRKKEVDDAITNAKTLMQKYINDYGIYSFISSNDDEIFNSRFWNWMY